MELNVEAEKVNIDGKEYIRITKEKLCDYCWGTGRTAGYDCPVCGGAKKLKVTIFEKEYVDKLNADIFEEEYGDKNKV